MKHRLKTHQLILLGILAVLVLACGAVYAYMFMRTDAQSTQFVPATISCEATQKVEGDAKTSIVVTNPLQTAEEIGSNVYVYLRVRLVTYWVDGEGKIAAKSSPELKFTAESSWEKSAGSDTYYYTSPVAPGVSTTNLLATAIDLETAGEYRQVVDVFAEAIQAKPTTAVTTSWGVTLDSTGNIIAAP